MLTKRIILLNVFQPIVNNNLQTAICFQPPICPLCQEPLITKNKCALQKIPFLCPYDDTEIELNKNFNKFFKNIYKK